MDELFEEFSVVPNLTVVKKENMPERFHYRHNKRIQPIVIYADNGFTICNVGKDGYCQRKGIAKFK